MNLFTSLLAKAGRDDICLRMPGAQAMTYHSIDARSAALAGALRSAGVGPGDRVVAQIEKSADALALYLACLRSGAVYLPLNTAYTDHEVEYFVDDAEPALVVTRPHAPGDDGAARTMTLGTDGSGSLAEAADAAEPFDGVIDRSDDDLAAMLYTSGTTGRSKGAMLTHGNLAANARALHDVWQFRGDDVLLHVLPIFHVHGLFVAMHPALLAGIETIFLPRFTVDDVVEHLPAASVMMGVPTQYVRLLEDDRFDDERCRNIRLFTSGSAPMTERVHQRMTEQTGHEIVERYGMTECGILTSNPVDGERRPGTVGFALPGVEVRVTDPDGRVVPPDTTGSVEVRGPSLFAGYWRLPEKTAAEHRAGGWFVTGDVGSVDDAGRLTLEGRSGDMIISGGYNVYPKEIEIVLDEVAGVDETAVIGVPHPDFGEAVVAIVVRDGTVGVDDATLDSALDGVLARFKHPKRYLWVDELPRNAMSKVQKAELRDRYATLFD